MINNRIDCNDACERGSVVAEGRGALRHVPLTPPPPSKQLVLLVIPVYFIVLKNIRGNLTV